jgi:hypothetical protein
MHAAVIAARGSALICSHSYATPVSTPPPTQLYETTPCGTLTAPQPMAASPLAASSLAASESDLDVRLASA